MQEFVRLRREVVRLRQELEEVKNQLRDRNPHPVNSPQERPTGSWYQLYFRKPFHREEAMRLFGECIEEALKKKLLKGDDLCDVELVVEDDEDPTRRW